MPNARSGRKVAIERLEVFCGFLKRYASDTNIAASGRTDMIKFIFMKFIL